nr:uncharacterized protein LOC109762757 [Aegilops tauschii subsp. strangulata]
MNQALAQKDLDLAAAQKAAEEKTALANQKLASVGKLEEENAKLKTTLDEANREATRLKKDKNNLTEKMEGIARKRGDLENYLGGLAKKMFIMLEGAFFCPTDLLMSTRYITIDSSLYCACRILPELRGRNWAS